MGRGEMRVLLDGTPLLGQRTGIGRYTAALAAELAAESTVHCGILGLTLRGWYGLHAAAPKGVRVRGFPAPARLLRACWARGPVPPVELLAGTAAVVHGTNFVLPPALRARGVVTIHDLAFLDTPGELAGEQRDLPALVGESARRAAVVCTPTEAVGESVSRRLGVEREKIVVTPLGVDPEWFDAAPPDAALRRKHRLPEDYLVFVGSGSPRKGLPVLLDAYEAGLPPLVLAGPVADDPLPSRVLRTGYLPDAELRSVVAGARALVLPSRDEGFGLPALEALACGIPVVCSNIPALREVTAGHAVQVAVGEPAALRHALHRALDLPGDSAARRAHAARFTWRQCAEATLAAYRMAVSPA